MKIFKLVQYDYEGDSYSLWTHENKEQEQFKEDCEWIIKTHIDQLYEPQKEEEDFLMMVGSEEVIELIKNSLPKLGYEPIKTQNFGFWWHTRAENSLEGILNKDELNKLFEHNDKADEQW